MLKMAARAVDQGYVSIGWSGDGMMVGADSVPVTAQHSFAASGLCVA